MPRAGEAGAAKSAKTQAAADKQARRRRKPALLLDSPCSQAFLAVFRTLADELVADEVADGQARQPPSGGAATSLAYDALVR